MIDYRTAPHLIWERALMGLVSLFSCGEGVQNAKCNINNMNVCRKVQRNRVQKWGVQICLVRGGLCAIICNGSRVRLLRLLPLLPLSPPTTITTTIESRHQVEQEALPHTNSCSPTHNVTVQCAIPRGSSHDPIMMLLMLLPGRQDLT